MPTLVADLQNDERADRASLKFRVQKAQRIAIAVGVTNRLELAKENREYPLSFTSQFTQRQSFVQIFVIHPWFCQGMLHQNFRRFVALFTAELSGLAFFSFADDATLVAGAPRSQVATLLSGLVFLNAWPARGADAPRSSPFCRVFLNSRAAHLLSGAEFAPLQTAFGNEISGSMVVDG